MCLTKKQYGDYMAAEAILRRLEMNNQISGYEYLKIAFVIAKEKSITDEKFLIEEVKKQIPMIVSKGEVIKDRGSVEQKMIEAIRSISPNEVKMSIMEFVNQMLVAM